MEEVDSTGLIPCFIDMATGLQGRTIAFEVFENLLEEFLRQMDGRDQFLGHHKSASMLALWVRLIAFLLIKNGAYSGLLRRDGEREGSEELSNETKHFI